LVKLSGNNSEKMQVTEGEETLSEGMKKNDEKIFRLEDNPFYYEDENKS